MVRSSPGTGWDGSGRPGGRQEGAHYRGGLGGVCHYRGGDRLNAAPPPEGEGCVVWPKMESLQWGVVAGSLRGCWKRLWGKLARWGGRPVALHPVSPGAEAASWNWAVCGVLTSSLQAEFSRSLVCLLVGKGVRWCSSSVVGASRTCEFFAFCITPVHFLVSLWCPLWHGAIRPEWCEGGRNQRAFCRKYPAFFHLTQWLTFISLDHFFELFLRWTDITGL